MKHQVRLVDTIDIVVEGHKVTCMLWAATTSATLEFSWGRHTPTPEQAELARKMAMEQLKEHFAPNCEHHNTVIAATDAAFHKNRALMFKRLQEDKSL